MAMRFKSRLGKSKPLRAPFPYFGGKSQVVDLVWSRLGAPKQYIEPFCGSAAMLLGAPRSANLEVIGDANGFIANFWRVVKFNASEVASWADYPVSHVDLFARHRWLLAQRERLMSQLLDPVWPGDSKVAGWWVWGQCAWIGGGWCDWEGSGKATHPETLGQIVQLGGSGVHKLGKIVHVSDAGRGVQRPNFDVYKWMERLSLRLRTVRVIHGSWDRCLNHHYGADDTAIFFDPPYKAFETLYGVRKPVASDVEGWCREHPGLRIALCGHIEDYDLPGWEQFQWNRKRLMYGGDETTDKECIWFSPGCAKKPTGDPGRDGERHPATTL